jgi:hypothetical protein
MSSNNHERRSSRTRTFPQPENQNAETETVVQDHLAPKAPLAVRGSIITSESLEEYTTSKLALLLPEGLHVLLDVDALKVSQELELFEMFGLETKNKYSVRDGHGKRLFHMAEDTSLINRCCTGKDRPFTIHIYDTNKKVVMKVKRPCSCGLCWWGGRITGSNVTIKSAAKGELFGRVVQVCSCCTPHFHVMSAEDEKIMEISGPCCSTWCKCLMCCNVDFDITLVTGGQHLHIGKITKNFSLKEMVGDANNFTLHFPKELDPRVKACLLGASLSLDYAFFETHALQHGCCRKCSWCVLVTIIVVVLIGILVGVLLILHLIDKDEN